MSDDMISKTAALAELNARAQKIEACEAEYRTWGGPDPRGESAGPLMLQKARELREIAAAIAALPAVTVGVRPLVWEPSVIGKPWHSAKAPWGWYYAQWDDETKAWFASLEMGEVEAPIILSPSDVPTLEAAKAAAQADYEARILAALTTQPAPDASAYTRTGVMDKDGREICVGDRIMIDVNSGATKREYWCPEYEVVFDPPCFTLKHVGGDKDSDTARFYWRVPQPRSTAKITTLFAAAQDPTPAPDAQAIREAALREAAAEVQRHLTNWANNLADTRDAYREAVTTGKMNGRNISEAAARKFARDFNERAEAVAESVEHTRDAILALIPKGGA